MTHGDLRYQLTIETGVVGLHKGLFHLAVLDEQSIALTADVAEDGGAVEGQVKSLAEFGGRVTQKADLIGMLVNDSTTDRSIITYAALAVGVKGLGPSLGAVVFDALACSRVACHCCFLHEWVVDGDDKDLAGLLELGVVDEAGDVGAGAGGA
jgi:hypothetical protein